MRTLVTGGSGFIGSHVTRRLVAADGSETVLMLRSAETPWRLRDQSGGYRTVVCDLMQHHDVAQAVREIRPDRVIHMAWDGVLGRHRNSVEQHRNVGTTLNLLAACGEAGVRSFVGLGSQAEYGPRNERSDETAPCLPTTVYGAAKLGTVTVAQRMAEEMGIRFAWMRLFSSYGPMDHPDWLLPYLIQSLIRGERPAVTAGEQLWDFLYAGDAADAIVAVSACDQAQGIFNLGHGKAEKLRTVIEQLRDAIDPRLPIGFGEVPYRPDQVMHLEADITRLTRATGWTPRTTLGEGLRQTVEWFREQ